jgi:hypothetical protein
VAHEVHLHRREWQWTSSGWAHAHRLVLLLMLCAAIAVAFLDGSPIGPTLAAFHVVVCTCGILFARFFEAPLTDFLRGLSPRDSVLFFLAHGMVLVLPSLVGFGDWRVAVAALMAFVSFLAVDRLGFGRLHALSLVLVFLGVASQPLRSFPLLAAYGLFYLLSLRLQHLSERLDQFGEGRGLPIVPAFIQTIGWVVVPWAVATAFLAWLTPVMADQTRYLVFDWGGRSVPAVSLEATSSGELLRDLAILALLVAAMTAAIWWFERQLGLRRRGNGTEQPISLTSATSLIEPVRHASAAPHREDLGDARGRIVARFRSLAAEFTRLGFGRARSETAPEYITRVQHEVGKADLSPDEPLSAFERACYSSLSVSDSEADAFIRWATAVEKGVDQNARSKGSTKHPPDATA